MTRKSKAAVDISTLFDIVLLTRKWSIIDRLAYLHQNWQMWLRPGWHTACKVCRDWFMVSALQVRDFAVPFDVTSFYVRFLVGSSIKLQPTQWTSFLRKIRYTTSFRVRKYLSGVTMWFWGTLCTGHVILRMRSELCSLHLEKRLFSPITSPKHSENVFWHTSHSLYQEIWVAEANGEVRRKLLNSPQRCYYLRARWHCCNML